MKICIGITSYNRIGILKKMKNSLCASEGLEYCNIRIYDDCSNEYDSKYLKKIFPNVTEIIRRKRNIGACRNMRQMYVDFLKTKDELLIAADSDLIFNPEWVFCY